MTHHNYPGIAFIHEGVQDALSVEDIDDMAFAVGMIAERLHVSYQEITELLAKYLTQSEFEAIRAELHPDT